MFFTEKIEKEIAQEALRQQALRKRGQEIDCSRPLLSAKPQAQYQDCLAALKSRAKHTSCSEKEGQMHWFSAVSPICPQIGSQKVPQQNPNLELERPKQSRLDAILDLLALGSSHYSSNRHL